MDREKVVAWLTEISLRPCDFTTDDFDAYETEYLANEALEICEAAKVFNKQRNDALALLKEQDAVTIKKTKEHGFGVYGGICPKCRNWIQSAHSFCGFCGQAVKWE